MQNHKYGKTIRFSQDEEAAIADVFETVSTKNA